MCSDALCMRSLNIRICNGYSCFAAFRLSSTILRQTSSSRRMRNSAISATGFPLRKAFSRSSRSICDHGFSSLRSFCSSDMGLSSRKRPHSAIRIEAGFYHHHLYANTQACLWRRPATGTSACFSVRAGTRTTRTTAFAQFSGARRERTRRGSVPVMCGKARHLPAGRTQACGSVRRSHNGPVAVIILVEAVGCESETQAFFEETCGTSRHAVRPDIMASSCWARVDVILF